MEKPKLERYTREAGGDFHIKEAGFISAFFVVL